MPHKPLPEKFKTTLRGLIAQGWKPKDAMREAWRVYKGTGPGMSRTQQPQKYLNPSKQTKCPVCRSLCAPGEKYHPGCKPPRRLKVVRKNPIAVYNPSRTPLPLKNVTISYQRANGEYRNQWFKHAFKSSVFVFGLSDGSILIKSKGGKKLWGTV